MSTEYIFYSGGFDTTAYLLDCLISRKTIVQPIVVKVPFIDGKEKKRKSAYQEQVSRNNFYSKFKDLYPNLKSNLLNEMVFDNVILDEDTLKLGKEAYRKGYFSREINQLLYFHQISKNNDIEGVVGYVKEDVKLPEIWEFFKNNFRFKTPMQHYSKEYLLERAKEYEYDNFLYETWSCWNPQPNNVPCGECALCRITIVDTQLKFKKTSLL